MLPGGPQPVVCDREPLDQDRRSALDPALGKIAD